MSNYKLSASKRTLTGRRVRQLRRDGIIPANIFGKKIKSISIQVDQKALKETLKKAGETNLIDLKLEDGKTHPVLVASYAQDPVSGALLHVDFHEVDLTVKTTAMVPVHTTGESEAVKGGNILVLQHNEIEVEALPADLPDKIEVDISALTEISSTIHAKDLKLDRSKVTLMLEDDEVIATIQEPAQEEAPVAAESEEGTEAATTEDKSQEANTAESSTEESK